MCVSPQAREKRREEKRSELDCESATSTPAGILIVDDSLGEIDPIRAVLEKQGHEVHLATAFHEASILLRDFAIDLVIAGPQNTEEGALGLLGHVRERYAFVEVLVMTAGPAEDTAFRAGRLGAHAHLKNSLSPDDLLAAVDSALEQARRHRLADSLSVVHGTNGTRWGMVGESPQMQGVYRGIQQVAPFPDSVLILGETGTGKELIARAVHEESGRRGAFIAVNCAGTPSELLESELFGYSRGAFTGADRDKKGLLAAASGGTLLLDEIGDMPPQLQPKMLRFLQDGRMRPVGSIDEVDVDVRILAATHQDLQEAMAAGRFRQDLFHRLNVLTIRVPPLREREDDVPLLLAHFLRRKAASLNRTAPRCTPGALAAILACRWTGNVRDLENLVTRLLATCPRDTIDVPDLPKRLRSTSTTVTAEERLPTLEEKKTEYCRYVFAKAGRNVARAAQILDIDRKTLRARLAGARSRRARCPQ